MPEFNAVFDNHISSKTGLLGHAMTLSIFVQWFIAWRIALSALNRSPLHQKGPRSGCCLIRPKWPSVAAAHIATSDQKGSVSGCCLYSYIGPKGLCQWLLPVATSDQKGSVSGCCL